MYIYICVPRPITLSCSLCACGNDVCLFKNAKKKLLKFMYVCMYVYMYACMYVYMYACMYVCVYMYVCVCIFVYVCRCYAVLVCVCRGVCM